MACISSIVFPLYFFLFHFSCLRLVGRDHLRSSIIRRFFRGLSLPRHMVGRQKEDSA
jgi:hypothetical protein